MDPWHSESEWERNYKVCPSKEPVTSVGVRSQSNTHLQASFSLPTWAARWRPVPLRHTPGEHRGTALKCKWGSSIHTVLSELLESGALAQPGKVFTFPIKHFWPTLPPPAYISLTWDLFFSPEQIVPAFSGIPPCLFTCCSLSQNFLSPSLLLVSTSCV